MDSTTLTDLSQSLLQSDSLHLVPKKAERKEPFLVRLINRIPSGELRDCLLYSYPWREDKSLRSTMMKIGLDYFLGWACYEFEVLIEFEAYYVLLIELLFKEKILSYSKGQFWWDFLPLWNKKVLELYTHCTESDLIKIAFLVTHPVVTVKLIDIPILCEMTQNLMLIFDKNSPPYMDIFGLAAYHRKTNPFLVEVERDGYLEKSLKPTIISLSAQYLTKKLLNSRSRYYALEKHKTQLSDMMLQLVFKVLMKEEETKYYGKGEFTEAVVERMRNKLTSFDALSLDGSDFAYLKSFLNSNTERFFFLHDSLRFLQCYLQLIVNIKTLLPNSFS